MARQIDRSIDSNGLTPNGAVAVNRILRGVLGQGLKGGLIETNVEIFGTHREEFGQVRHWYTGQTRVQDGL